MMIAEHDGDGPEAREPHILRLVPKPVEQPRQVSAPEKLYEALEAACEAGGLQLNEASITLVPRGFEVVHDHTGHDEDEDTASHHAFAMLEAAEGPLALVETDPDTVFMTVSALLGADAESEVAPIERPLSNAEWEFISIIGDDLCTLLSVMNIQQTERCEVELLHKGPNADQLDAVAPGVKLTMALLWGPQTGTLTVTLPLGLVERVFAGTDATATATVASNASWGLKLKRSVGKAPVRVSAVLPVGARTLRQIRQLKAGDILDLNPLGDIQRIRLTANGHTLFTAELGKVGKVYSARIIACHTHPAKADETSVAK